nr:membrane-bound transcription factor site-2 protease homolog isoform X1 [Ipomoea batatas]
MRRSGRGQSNQTLLPLRAARRLSNTISCWYCDFKFSMLNEPLFLFGRRYSRYFRSWFSMGVGFSLTALLGVTLMLLWEMGKLLHLYNGETQFVTLLSGSLFGGLSGLTISLADIGYLCISTIVSVSVHELGHALAAASEGIQMEYIAVFLAVLFPGALVAFNDEILQAFTVNLLLFVYTVLEFGIMQDFVLFVPFHCSSYH